MKKTYRVGIQALLVLILLGGGLFLFRYLASHRVVLEREDPPPAAPMVRVERVTAGTHAVTVRGEGTVLPGREIRVVPQVAGKVIRLSASMVDGGRFAAGEEMLRIDPRDYEAAVALARARLADADAFLQHAVEESEAAIDEWRAHFSPDPGRNPPPLVARLPRLEAARAQADALSAELERAKLNLERTRITAPFAGVVSEKAVDLGQYVAPGQGLAGLLDTRAVEIVVSLEDAHLAWLSVPGFTREGGEGSPALVSAVVAGRDMEWAGQVVRAQARLDPRTRMVRVVVRVDEPYARMPPLAVGLFATVDIRGEVLEDVIIIPRAALRQGNVVWTVDAEDRLRFAEVRVARVSDQGVVVTRGLSSDDRVAVSLLQGVSDGMRVRAAGGLSSPAGAGEAPPENRGATL